MKKILIVDDEKDLRDELGGFLQENQFEVREAQNGLDAFRVLDSYAPDLIILDIAMPEMDGFEFLERQKNDDRYAPIPVIILTVKSERKNIEKGISLHAEFYLPKPFSGDDLMQYIRMILGE